MQFNSYIVSNTKTALSVPVFNKTNIEIKNKKSFKRFAFTLAETLITLTIIGVVAALTIPNLLNKYTKHTYVVGLKKAYSQLSNAMKMIPITEGCSAGDYDCAGMFQQCGKVTNIDGMDFGSCEPNEKNLYLISKQFKTQKICYNMGGECSEVYHLESIISGYAGGAFITNDGMIWGIHLNNEISVDINGYKQPNKIGRDQFAFRLAEQSINNIQQGTVMPIGSYIDKKYGNEHWKEDDRCTIYTDGWHNRTCTGRVLEEDAMNY